MAIRFERLLFAAVVMASAAGGALANVNTFSAVPEEGVIDSYTEDGITVSTPMGFIYAFPEAGQVHLDPLGQGTSSIMVTYGGGLFDFVGFDISYTSPGAIAGVLAFDANDNLLDARAVDAGIEGPVSFSGWTGISYLTITDTVDHFSIDNLALNPAPVPEPATSALAAAGLGIVALGARRRRRQATA